MSKRKAELMNCERCGDSVFRRRRVDRVNLCLRCATDAVRQAAQEMVAKSGPAWDAWLASNATKAHRRGPD